MNITYKRIQLDVFNWRVYVNNKFLDDFINKPTEKEVKQVYNEFIENGVLV